MENQANSKSIIVNYGLYLGVSAVLINLVIYAMGMHLDQSWIAGTAGFVIMIIFIVLGIKKYKEANGGFLSWGQAVKIGVGISLISALISIVYQQIFNNFIEPDFMAQTLEKTQQAWVDAGMTEEQIESSLEMTKKMQTPLILSAMGIIVSAFIGFIISAIGGAIMKESEEEQY